MDANARVDTSMSKELLQVTAEKALHHAWVRFESQHDKIGRKPSIILNTRTWRTAGRAWLEQGIIELSYKLFIHHRDEFIRVIIPHEAAHHVAFRVYEDAGHGPAWKQVMVDYGLPAKLYHSMELPK